MRSLALKGPKMPRNALLNALQAASNEAAGAISGPVDLLGMGLRGLGVPVPKNALLSSEWMANRGLTRPVQQGPSQVAGATLGLLSPIAAAAKAPQVARGLLFAEDAGKRGAYAVGEKANDMANSYMTRAGMMPRMVLADEDGIAETFHHGTSKLFPDFSMDHAGTVWGDKASKAGFFFTKDPTEARYFADVAVDRLGGAPMVLKAEIDANRLATITSDDLSRHTSRWLNSLPDDEKDFQLATRAYDAMDGGISKGLEIAILDAKARGHDAARVVLDDGTNWVIAFKKEAIKRKP